MKKLYKVSKNNNLLLINNLSLKSINDLPKKIVVDLYNQHGALLFRNFKIGIGDIQKFTDKFTKIYANDAGRRKEVENTKHVKTVDKGNKMMPLHSEASYSPSWPDIVWFYCITPSLKSGFTTLCDGTQVYKRFKINTKKYFLENEINYFVEIPIQIKKNKKKLIRKWHFDEVGCIDPILDEKHKKIVFIQKRYAINKVVNLDKLSFVNHLQIILDRDPQLKKWTIGNKKKLPYEIIKDVKQCCKNETYNIVWKKNDLCMINNKRFMHGRTKIESSDKKLRKIVNIQTLKTNIGLA